MGESLYLSVPQSIDFSSQGGGGGGEGEDKGDDADSDSAHFPARCANPCYEQQRRVLQNLNTFVAHYIPTDVAGYLDNDPQN